MNYMRQKLCALLWIAIGVTEIRAQVAIPSSGGRASGAGGSMAYSIGQVINATNTSTKGSVIESIHQAFEISVITTSEENKGLSLTAYPNPTWDYLMLKVDQRDIKTFHFQLYDINGNVLRSEQISEVDTKITMSNLSSSIYFMRIIKGNREVKTFKIIKK